jgi:hypothetical protein
MKLWFVKTLLNVFSKMFKIDYLIFKYYLTSIIAVLSKINVQWITTFIPHTLEYEKQAILLNCA